MILPRYRAGADSKNVGSTHIARTGLRNGHHSRWNSARIVIAGIVTPRQS